MLAGTWELQGNADCSAEWQERLTKQKGEYFKVNKSYFK